MENFTYFVPTKILFGKGQIANITQEIPKDAHILMTYGGGSIKKNGVYDQVMKALKGFSVTEFPGIEPNPEYDTCMRAVDIIKEKKITFLLAVGGGSVIDGTKFIAAAAKFEAGDPWDILAKGAAVHAALPIGTVLTLPATGTEMNHLFVLSRRSQGKKLDCICPPVAPLFSVLDPETTFSLPKKQISNGVVDAFVHVVEQYLTYPAQGHLQDRFSESILQTLLEIGPVTLAKPRDYDARASMMWCAAMALNTLIACGVPQDWSTHMIGHELTALHGLDHAQTLAVILPGVMDVMRDKKREKLLQYAERVWQITAGDEDARIDTAIEKTRAFFVAMGVPTTLSAYQLTPDDVRVIVDNLAANNKLPLGENRDMDKAIVLDVLARCG
jgi:NADP-dependent alcohol dehydrogenase